MQCDFHTLRKSVTDAKFFRFEYSQEKNTGFFLRTVLRITSRSYIVSPVATIQLS